MSIRHWITVKKGDEVMKDIQIIGNNDYFDEEFYENMGLQVTEDGEVEETEIKLSDLLVEWHEWLNRHPEKKGIGRDISKGLYYAKLVYLEYVIGNYYQLEPYKFMDLLSRHNYLDDAKGEIKEGYKLTIEVY